MSDKRIENTIPVLPVRDLDRSLEFYRTILGFELDWRALDICSVVRDGCRIMLQRSTDASPATVWIGLEDASLYSELVGSGATIIQAPTKQPWAYEMKVADPDGNTLWLGAEPSGD